jgi:hypothetical protein
MVTYYYDPELLKFLGLNPNEKYSSITINNKIYKKKLVGHEIKKVFPKFQTCGCGHCSVDHTDFINFVNKNLVFKNNPPSCNFYEFNQSPVEIKRL